VSPTLEELKNNRSELMENLKTVNAKIREEKLRMFTEKTEVSIGSIVQSGSMYKVSDIDTEYGWISGYKQKKDGTFGKQKRNLFSTWTLVK